MIEFLYSLIDPNLLRPLMIIVAYIGLFFCFSLVDYLVNDSDVNLKDILMAVIFLSFLFWFSWPVLGSFFKFFQQSNSQFIIKPKLKSLIISHLNAEQIAEILHIDKSSVFHLTKEFWNKTLTQAWKTFIKIFLRSLIIEGFSAKEISKRLNVDFSTVYRLTKQFWNVRFSEAKDYLI